MVIRTKVDTKSDDNDDDDDADEYEECDEVIGRYSAYPARIGRMFPHKVKFIQVSPTSVFNINSCFNTHVYQHIKEEEK